MSDAVNDGPARVDLVVALQDLRAALVRAVMRRLGVDRDAAEDLVQDATVAALAQGPQLKTHAEWFGYLRTASANLGITKFRREAREHERVETAAARVAWLAAKPIPEPAELVAAEFLLIDALEDLDRLPTNQREVFLLRYRDELTLAEIAATLGLGGRRAEYRLRSAERNLAKMQAERSERGAYAFLALLMRRTHEAQVTVASLPVPAPCVVALAATLAFSIVTAIANPGLPTPGDPAVTRRTTAAITAAGGVPVSDEGRPVRQPARAGSADWRTTGSLGTARMVDRLHVPTSLTPPCVTLCATHDRGDVWTIRVLGKDETVNENVVPLCRSIPPPPPGLTCRPGEDPDGYIVKLPPSPSEPGGSPWSPSEQRSWQ